MRKRSMMLIFLLILCMCGFSGCTQAAKLENHSFALVMGIDRMEDESLQMTVIVPKISGGSEEGGASSSAGNYSRLSVNGLDYEDALEKLDWASPRDLNLSHLKLIVLSQEIAREERCGDLIENIAQTERLFTSAWVTVCEGRAQDFVNAVKPAIGTRISTDIDALFEHYIDRGYLPATSLADLYYQSKSVYSDPMVAYALLSKSQPKEKTEEAVPASVFDVPINEISESYDSEFATRYLGAAVFSDGSMRGVLNGAQTIMASMIRNELESFRYAFNGQSLQFVPARSCFVHVDTKSEPAKITINAHLAVASQEELPDEDKLREEMKRDIMDAIRAAQSMGTEPFGFAEKAAGSFLTMDEWMEYDWKNHFLNAEFDVKVRFAHSDA